MPPPADIPSATTPVLHARGSHLYRGARGSIEGGPLAGPCLVEFADGAAALAHLAPGAGHETLLAAHAYRTARGTRIEAKTWRLRIDLAGPGEPGFLVIGRA